MARSTRRMLKQRWYGMLSRCLNQGHQGYKNYGGRGIKICDDWMYSFESFHDWAVNNGFSPELFLDRNNNDGDYEPSNCSWVDRWHQNANRRPSNPRKGKYLGLNQLPSGSWRAKAQHKGFSFSQTFPTAEEAAKARDLFIKKHKLPNLRSKP